MKTIIFLGTPQMSADLLEEIIKDNKYKVVGVISQPDKPLGRKKILTPSPVSMVALKYNIPLHRPEKLNNDYEFIFNEKKQNIYLSINKRNNQFIDLITYLNKYHFLNNNHFSYIQPNIKNMNDLNQVIEFIENKTILPVIYLNISLKDFKNEILTEIQSTAYILTSEDENFHQAFQKHFHLRNNSYILYLNHEFQKISFLKKESPQEFIEKVKIKIQSYVLQRTYSFPYNMKDFQHHIIKK